MSCEEYGYCKADYEMWQKRWVLAECFIILKMNKYAKEVLRAPISIVILNDYLSIILKASNMTNNGRITNLLTQNKLING